MAIRLPFFLHPKAFGRRPLRTGATLLTAGLGNLAIGGSQSSQPMESSQPAGVTGLGWAVVMKAQ